MKKKNKKINKFEKWAKDNKYSIGFFAKIIIPTISLIVICIFVPYINLYLDSKSAKVEENDNQNQENKDGQVKSKFIENNSECDSDFLDDNKWGKDERWIQNGQEFVFIPDKTKKGGPRMDFKDLVSDNFHLAFDFKSVANENNKNNEINLVVYIGDLYEIVLGDGNRENFYLKSNGKFVPDIKNNLYKNTFEHPIMFDQWMTIEINQYVPENSQRRTISVSFYYCPYISGKDECNKGEPEIYSFEINDSSNPEKVSRLIGIGLRNSDSVIKNKFLCFELENR